MNLILWRHAEAEDVNSQGDLARELTRRGRKQAQQMAHWLEAHLEGEWRIVVSPARRTLQTVEPLEREFEVREALAPGTYPEKVLREAGWPDAGTNVLLVGHQPTLGEVAALLLRGLRPVGRQACALGECRGWGWVVQRGRRPGRD